MQSELSVTNCWLMESVSSKFYQQVARQCEDRPPNGYVCIGCDLLAVCIKRNGEWEVIRVELCATDDGYVCNEIEGACSNKTGPCNQINNGAFACTAVGTFPDPYDCQLYHVCYMNGNNTVSADINCNQGRAYNPLTGDCDLTLNSNVCLEYGFTCTKAGDIGPWLHNPNIFYVCKADITENEKIIYPELYKCDLNEIFVHNECVSKDVTTTTTSTTNAPDTDFKCTKPGVFPDVNSCKHYYYCNSLLQAQRYKCADGTFFNQVYLQCTIGDC